MRKIVFNATILNKRPTGLGVYCRNVLSRIDKELIAYTLFSDKSSENDFKANSNMLLNIESKIRFKKIILRNYMLKRWLKNNCRNNILHYSPTQHGVSNKTIKQIITIHDLMPLYFPKGRLHQYIYYKFYLRKIIKNSEVVITVSNNTKNDIIKEYNISSEKIKVIYNGFNKSCFGVDKEKSRKYIEKKYNIKNYILMIGIHYEYKNLHSVIEAYENQKDNISNPLVIAGGVEGSYGQKLIKMIERKGLRDRVKFLGYIPDEDKDMLYQGAKMFIYPSKYEGFGLPILEAMANDTVVACSNTSSLPEVAGDAAVMFNPNEIKEIENTLIKLSFLSEIEEQKYIEKGREQIKKFSWDKCANEIVEIIKSIE